MVLLAVTSPTNKLHLSGCFVLHDPVPPHAHHTGAGSVHTMWSWTCYKLRYKHVPQLVHLHTLRAMCHSLPNGENVAN